MFRWRTRARRDPSVIASLSAASSSMSRGPRSFKATSRSRPGSRALKTSPKCPSPIFSMISRRPQCEIGFAVWIAPGTVSRSRPTVVIRFGIGSAVPRKSGGCWPCCDRLNSAISAIVRNWRIGPLSSRDPWASSSSQSTAAPPEIDVAKATSLVSSSFTVHLPCKADQSAADRHPRGVGRWFSKRLRELLVVHVHLDPADDRGTVLLTETLQRHFVPLESPAPDGLLQRRCRGVGLAPVNGNLGDALAALLYLGPDAIEDSLAQIGLKGAFVPGLEIIDPPERLQERRLHQVVRVHETTRPSGEAATRPPPQAGHVARHEMVQRSLVALARAAEQLRGGLQAGCRTLGVPLLVRVHDPLSPPRKPNGRIIRLGG